MFFLKIKVLPVGWERFYFYISLESKPSVEVNGFLQNLMLFKLYSRPESDDNLWRYTDNENQPDVIRQERKVNRGKDAPDKQCYNKKIFSSVTPNWIEDQ